MPEPELKMARIDARQGDVSDQLAALRHRLSPHGNVVSEAGRQRTIDVFGEALTPEQVVARICNDVRDRGLPAVLEYSSKLDRADLTLQTLRVPAEDLAEAHAKANPALLASVRRIRENILKFQKALLNETVRIDWPDGSYLQHRYLPMDRVGICVPGGAAAYPSTLLMTAVPAQAAGVKQLVVVSPPTANGSYHPDVLATCHELGVAEVYRMGGAQAVAALAYGVEGVPRVDKIVGPGNTFVALAKKRVYGDVDIDAIAGPSEIVVIADDTTRADFTAADLIAQAEHSPGAGILITWSEKTLEAVAKELFAQTANLERGELARQSLEQFGALILVKDVAQACAVADSIAAEHLHIATNNSETLLGRIRHAGAVFLGNYTPVAVGDYVAGPSHVLPTGGTARFASGLSANSFLRSHSVLHYTRGELCKQAPDVREMADVEGLTAHRHSVDIRTGKGQCS